MKWVAVDTRITRSLFCALLKPPPTCGYSSRPSTVDNHNRQLTSVKRSYQLLQVTSEHSNTEVKEAFIRLAKKHHPDSSDAPDGEKFKAAEQAYRAIMEHRKLINVDQAIEDVLESSNLGIRHTAPQHRQYLSNEGIGYGTPGQRERQYHNFRLNRANERAFNYRLNKMSEYTEDALVVQDREATKRFKTQNAIERVVEDLIQSSMARGEFQKLAGMGKPLSDADYNPYVDSMTHKLNRILINNGFVPEWAMLGKEIETMKSDLRSKLIDERAKYGDSPTSQQKVAWEAFLQRKKNSFEDINEKIFKFNFVCPTIQQQLSPLRLDIMGEKVFNGDSWKDHRKLTDSKTENVVSNKQVDEGKWFWNMFNFLK